MLFFGKENIFMCLVAFSQIFRKIFSSVWKRRRKRQTQKNMNKTQIDAWCLTGFDGAVLCEFQFDNHVVDRDLMKHRAASRDHDRREGEIMIDDAILQNDDQREGEIAINGVKARSRSTAWDHDLRSQSTTLVLANRADWSSVSAFFSLSLSLSLSPKFIWSENRNENSFP